MCTWESKKRIVLVGDARCGKTSLAVRMSQDLFVDFYSPTDFDDFSAEFQTKKGSCKLTVLDTAGRHDETEIRSLAYKGCDAVIVCFDLTNQSTLDSVETHWLPELKEYCPGVPFYFAGLKRDAMCKGRCTCGGDCCTQNEEELMAIIEKTGAVAYIECSAATGASVEDAFQIILDTVPTPKRKTSAKKVMASLKKKSKLLRRLSHVFI